MADWRINGRVMATLRSRYGLHMVVHARTMEFRRFHGRDVPYIPVLCRHSPLSDMLERQLQIRDRIRLFGMIEPRTRPPSPIIKWDWEMIVTEAHIPRLSNCIRRLTRLRRDEYADDYDDLPPS